MAYAARVARSTDSTVAMSAMPKELTRARVKSPFFRISP